MSRLLLPLLLIASLAGSGCSVARQIGATFLGLPTSASSMAEFEGVIPASSMPFEDALEKARSFKGDDDSLRLARVAATGSMRPYLGEAALVVIESPDLNNLKPGSLVAFRYNGSEYIHVFVGWVGGGLATQGADGNSRRVVPLSEVTGTNLATVYFDKSTLPGDGGDLPLLLAANPEMLPPEAGTLRILGASMLTGTSPTPIRFTGQSRYAVSLPAGTSLEIEVGVPGSSAIDPAVVVVAWADDFAGEALRLQIYHPDAPETGIVLLDASFE